MLIPIPIGVKRYAAVRGAVWKFVTCAHCQQRFAYLLELEAVGEDHDLLFLDAEGSAKRAQARAEHNLQAKSRNCTYPVPCPACGFYQEDMSRLLKEEHQNKPLLVAGLVIALLGVVPLFFNIRFAWVLSAILAAIGLALIAYEEILASRYDPNAGDPEPRIARGRRHAVWGEQLTELLAANANAEQAIRAGPPCDAGTSSIKTKA